MTGDVPRHEVKKGAPDYRGMFRDEVLEHQATSRKLAAKDDNEILLLKKIEQQQEEYSELANLHINTVYKPCIKQQKEIERLAMYPAMVWALLGVILIIIAGSL